MGEGGSCGGISLRTVCAGDCDAAVCPRPRKDATHGSVNVGDQCATNLLSWMSTCTQSLQLAGSTLYQYLILQVEIQIKFGLGLWRTRRKAAEMIQMGILCSQTLGNLANVHGHIFQRK